MRTSRVLLSLAAATLLVLSIAVPVSLAQSSSGYQFLNGIWGVAEGGDQPEGPGIATIPATLPVTGAQQPSQSFQFLSGIWGVAEGGDLPEGASAAELPITLPVTGAQQSYQFLNGLWGVQEGGNLPEDAGAVGAPASPAPADPPANSGSSTVPSFLPVTGSAASLLDNQPVVRAELAYMALSGESTGMSPATLPVTGSTSNMDPSAVINEPVVGAELGVLPQAASVPATMPATGGAILSDEQLMRDALEEAGVSVNYPSGIVPESLPTTAAAALTNDAVLRDQLEEAGVSVPYPATSALPTQLPATGGAVLSDEQLTRDALEEAGVSVNYPSGIVPGPLPTTAAAALTNDAVLRDQLEEAGVSVPYPATSALPAQLPATGSVMPATGAATPLDITGESDAYALASQLGLVHNDTFELAAFWTDAMPGNDYTLAPGVLPVTGNNPADIVTVNTILASGAKTSDDVIALGALWNQISH